jgi:hypothetical protein
MPPSSPKGTQGVLPEMTECHNQHRSTGQAGVLGTPLNDEDNMIQEDKTKNGYVYILLNPAFTGYVKIGKTTKGSETRARELSSGTGVPAPFSVAWDAYVINCDHVEKLIHQRLAVVRSRQDREFFAISLKEAVAVVSEIVKPFCCAAESLSIRPNGQQEELMEAAAVVVDPHRNRFDDKVLVGFGEIRGTGIASKEYKLLESNPYKYTEKELFEELRGACKNNDMNFA